MDFDWKPLAGALIKAGAPVIGGALGGPLGGLAGNMLGGIVASALGVDATPEAVGNAITNGDPATVGAALSKADSEAVAKWDAIARIAQSQAEVDKVNIEQINETIRSEGNVSWYHWRHLIGYVTLAWLAVPLPPIAYHMLVGNITALNAIVAAFVSLIPIIAIAAGLNGYVAQDTNKLKGIAITGEQPVPGIAGAIKALVKKK